MKQIPESGPRLPVIVHRKRLHRQLDRLVAPGIVVVSAQAAQGKTTLIADYLQARGARSRWMALGPEDADPAYFGRHLVKVCQPYSGHGFTPSEKRVPPADTAIIAKLFRRLPPDLSLVFDGWHRTGSPAQAVRRINAIVAARPAQGGIYLISREDLPIELQRNRMRRQALLLTDEDLAFTEDEIGVFFRTVNGIALDANRRQQIQDSSGPPLPDAGRSRTGRNLLPPGR